jgi:hypothetical protein
MPPADENQRARVWLSDDRADPSVGYRLAAPEEW